MIGCHGVIKHCGLSSAVMKGAPVLHVHNAVRKKTVRRLVVNTTREWVLPPMALCVQFMLIMLLAFTTCLVVTPVRADVYLEKPFDPTQLASVSQLLPTSLRPGGTRRLRINGSEVLATRHVVKDSAQMIRALTHDMQVRYNRYPERGLDYQQLEDLIAQGEDQAKAPSQEVVESLVSAERDRIITAFELPFAYRVADWTVVARVPIAAIDPENPLADTPVTEGYLLFTQEPASGQSVTDLWELKFQEGFNLLAVLGNQEGDAVGDEPKGVIRFPGARRTLTYEESANHWYNKTWSFEAAGSVDSAMTHYQQQYEQAGFVIRQRTVVSSSERMAFMKRDDREIVLHMLDTGLAPRPIQITIQQYPVQ